MRTLWFLGGVISVILGVIGIVLPLLPTVPFLLLAAFCFARSSATAHNWLINHETLGPPILDWQTSGAIRRSAKKMASLCIGLAFAISVILSVPLYALALQVVVLTCVMIFIWTRPEA